MEYTNSQIRSIIAEYIHSERDRQIMSSRLIDGICLEKLAEMHDLSRKQVWNIVKKYEPIIFKHM